MHPADGRFSPSPTGALHLGNLRTALAAWCWSRSAGGGLLLRIDDLDPDRSRPEHEASQRADLEWLGIDFDLGVVRSTERRGAHDAAIERLQRLGRAYPCFCTRADLRAAATAPHGDGAAPDAYPGTCRSVPADEARQRMAAGERAALRLDARAARVTYDDLVLGPLRLQVDDLVLRRKDGVPSYNLACAVDDGEQGVGLVVRGADLATTTPRQLLIQRLLELPRPRYAHVPIVLGAGGARLAKRDGAVTRTQLEEAGLDAGRVRALLAASLGIPTGERSSADDLLTAFDPDRVPREAVAFDPRALELTAVPHSSSTTPGSGR